MDKKENLLSEEELDQVAGGRVIPPASTPGFKPGGTETEQYTGSGTGTNGQVPGGIGTNQYTGPGTGTNQYEGAGQ